ncbi:MAG: deoxyribonuclease IV [Bacteroidota bacterium]
MRKVPLLGAHMSIAGGIHTAFDRGEKIGCKTMQVFTKNSSQWFGKSLTEEDIRQYEEKAKKSLITPVIAHDCYLINLCAKNASILKKSRDALLDELQRCQALGILYLNFHPGSHMGLGEKEGIQKIAESINLIHEKTKEFSVKSVLETTAGQGTALGYTFEQLQAIIELVEEKKRIGVCIDTCHVFAAGYDIGTEEGYEKTFHEFDEVIGFDRLVAFHVNDSKKGLGSRIDRHEHIGKGTIGIKGFSLLMNDQRFQDIPKILETPKSEDMHEDMENLKVLEGLVEFNL